jgi:F-type H+-transporting ATPase subunit a
MTLLASGVIDHLVDYPLLGRFLTAHHILLLAAAGLMILVFSWAARRIATKPGKTGLLALLEVGLVFVRDDIVYPWLGEERGRKYLPLFWTIFFFILFSNLIGMLPSPLNPWHRTATGNLAVTAALAVVAFLTIQISGMKQHGWGKYWLHLVPHGVPKPLVPIVWLIEVVGLITKPFALTVRLFANMTAGHAILAVLYGFLWGIAHYTNAAIGTAATTATFAFMLFIMLFETLVALIQAYIFTVLTAIFTSLAVAEEH